MPWSGFIHLCDLDAEYRMVSAVSRKFVFQVPPQRIQAKLAEDIIAAREHVTSDVAVRMVPKRDLRPYLNEGRKTLGTPKVWTTAMDKLDA